MKIHNRSFPAPATAILASALLAVLAFPVVAQDAPVITEFMADNGETLIVEGASPDWIEIHNPGSTEIDLGGWHLTDNIQDPDRWTFPAEAMLASGAYLLIYASGEDRIGPSGEYHTNFALFDQGEYLALVRPDGTVHQEFAPTYPRQYEDVSYGLPPGAESYGYFQTPTPGAANNSAVQGFVRDTTFSHKRGFYDDAFELQVTTATPGATIYYTTNGRTPDSESAHVDALDPESPPVLSLTITTTTIVRAYAAKPGYESTNIDTQTYIFLDRAISSRSMSRTITQNPVWGPQMRDALLEIPSISLVTQGSIPTSPIQSPPEIPASIEMIFPDGRTGFQADVGIERFGGQYTVYPKHALRVSFKAIYGPKRLKFDLFSDTLWGGDTAVDSFDQILLRNGSHDSIFDHHYPHSRGTYIRNRYFFDRQIEAGHLSMRGKFVHVYLNGTYYGHYHLMERPNADFMATHQGGEKEDYDIMKGRSGIFAIEGNSDAWNYLNANLGNYTTVQQYMDVDSYIDYMLLNFYGGNDHDWYPQHNWVAGRKRVRGGKFQFFMWDNDFLVRRGGSTSSASQANTIDNGGPGNMFSALRQHEEFRIRLADRIQKHFFNGGMLTRERVKADFTELAQRITRTIIPETARWAVSAQDYNSSNGFYTPDSFQTYVDWLVNVNSEGRTDIVLGQMRSAGIFPQLQAPGIRPFGGTLVTGQSVSVTRPGRDGEIYYTVDGSDPRLVGGGINPTASTENPGTVTLPNGPGTIKARILSGGDWSPLVEAQFLVGRLAARGDLVITELNYRPAPPTAEEVAAGHDSRSHFEFLEIMNISGETIQLADLVMVEGFDFAFASSAKSSLAPGERGLLVYNRPAFLFRYPEVSPDAIIGEYAPDKLNNDGEEVLLMTVGGTVICQFTYNDVTPWPVSADGDGYTLVLNNPAGNPDPTNPLNWRNSFIPGGSPGTDDLSGPFAGWMTSHGATDPLAPFGSSSLPNLLAYAVGADLTATPEAALPVPAMVDAGGTAYPALRYRARTDGSDLTFLVEISENLGAWQSGDTITTPVGEPEDNGDGTVTVTVRSLQPIAARPDQYLRLRTGLAR